MFPPHERRVSEHAAKDSCQPVGTGERGTLADCLDRYLVRIREMQQSCRTLRQCLDGIPEGPVLGKVPRKFKPPVGDAYVRLEAAHGDMGWCCASDGSDYPHRVHVRTGSFVAMAIVDHVSRGLMIADLIAVIASLDVVAPEVDR